MTFSVHSQDGIAHLALISLVILIGIGVILFASGKLFLPSPATLRQSLGKSAIPKSSVFTVLPPNPIKDKAVSAIISAKNGGELKLVDDKGIEVTLTIPAGSLKSDTTITLAPLAEVPIKGYTSALTHGVLIEPRGVKFSPPAALVFDVKPDNSAPGLFGAGSSSSSDEQKSIEEQKDAIKKLWQSGQMLGVSDSNLTPTPVDAMGFGRGAGASAGIVYTNTDNGSVGLAPSQISSDGTQMSTPVTESGAYTPDDITGDKANDHAQNAASVVGTDCTIGNLRALNQALGQRSTYEMTLALRGTLRQCLEEKIAELAARCKNDPIKVRRLDFTILEKLIAKYFGNSEMVEKLRKLESECKSEYKIGGYGQNGPSTLTIEATTCGFIDDSWFGKDKFHIQIDAGFLDYGGTDTFVPPPQGGYFQVNGQGITTAVGFSSPYTGPVANGYFDNDKHFTFTAPGGVVVRTPIVFVGKACSSQLPGGDTLPPIEPIPGTQ